MSAKFVCINVANLQTQICQMCEIRNWSCRNLCCIPTQCLFFVVQPSMWMGTRTHILPQWYRVDTHRVLHSDNRKIQVHCILEKVHIQKAQVGSSWTRQTSWPSGLVKQTVHCNFLFFMSLIKASCIKCTTEKFRSERSKGARLHNWSWPWLRKEGCQMSFQPPVVPEW